MADYSHPEAWVRAGVAFEEERKGGPMIKVPKKCLCCGAGYAGGCQRPGKEFPSIGLRVFYKCGASMSIKESHDYGYLILFKNCGKEAAGE
jgi:hypothetical protein